MLFIGCCCCGGGGGGGGYCFVAWCIKDASTELVLTETVSTNRNVYQCDKRT